jgi:beta-fructofuranosidase
MSLPRVLNIDAHQRLQVTPAPELQALRKGQQHIHRSSFSSESGELFEHVAGNQLEIEAQFDLVQAEEAGIIICASPDRQEETRINVDVAANQLVVHREQSSIAPDATLDRTNQIAPLILTRGEPLRLHIFIDHSVIEIYVNGQICLTTRVYPHRSDSHHVGFFARGTVNMEVTVWKLQSIWE